MADEAELDSDPTDIDLSELSDASNVLLLSPSLGGSSGDVCLDLLTRQPAEDTNVVTVTFRHSPTEWMSEWNDGVGTSPHRGGIVAIGSMGEATEVAPWSVATIENPADLTGIGIELSELLSELDSARDEGEEIVMCFNSITSLLQYADLQRTFRFLHVVTGRIKTVDGFGHYHLDPEAHDSQTIATLKGLFDAVVELTDSGWEIKQ